MINLIYMMLKDKRMTLLGWSLGIAVMAMFTITFFPAISQSGGLENLTDTVPEQLQGLVGDSLSFTRYENYLSQQVFNFRMPLLLLIFAVIFTVGLTVAEEERGTLKTLQSLPVSRVQIALSKWIVIFKSTLLLSIVTGIAVLLSGILIGEEISLWQTTHASFIMWLLVLSVASIVFMLAMSTGKKGLTTGLSSLLLAATIIIPTVTIATPDLEPLAKSSLYYYYMEPSVYLNTPEPAHIGLFVAVTIISTVIGILFYSKRDITG